MSGWFYQATGLVSGFVAKVIWIQFGWWSEEVRSAIQPAELRKVLTNLAKMLWPMRWPVSGWFLGDKICMEDPVGLVSKIRKSLNEKEEESLLLEEKKVKRKQGWIIVFVLWHTQRTRIIWSCNMRPKKYIGPFRPISVYLRVNSGLSKILKVWQLSHALNNIATAASVRC